MGCGRVQHPAEIEGVKDVLKELQDHTATELLECIIDRLDILIAHFQIATDEEIEDGDSRS